MKVFVILLSLFVPVCSAFPVSAQQEQGAHDQQAEGPMRYGKKYLDLRIHRLDHYRQRAERQQSRLLARLKRKEQRLTRQLKRKDPAAYARLQQHPLSFDSISRLLRPDSLRLAAITGKGHPSLDSLQKIAAFLQPSGSPDGSPYASSLGRLQHQLGYQQYLNGLMNQRRAALRQAGAGSGLGSGVLKGMEKELFYARSKMKVFKQMAQEPSKAEAKALEYLQGTEGFEAALRRQGGMQQAAGVAELEQMGFQTRRQLNSRLQQQLGSGLSGVQQQMGQQVARWQESVNGVSGGIKQAGQAIKAAQAAAKQTGQTLKPVKLIGYNESPGRINPMRGLPFRKRLEKGFDFQTSRATADGQEPAKLTLGVTAAFRHTPRLAYGLGMAASVGLGADWSHIRLSFEGVGLRSFLTCKLIWGISAYGGYERFFNYTGRRRPFNERPPVFSGHSTASGSEAALAGLSKSYPVSSRWQGAVQVLYDVWWQQKGLSSPLILRFQTSSK